MSILKSQFYKLLGVLMITAGALNQSYTQENKTNVDLTKNTDLLKNEVKLNLAYAPFGYLEGAYERLLPGNSSLGLAIGKSIFDDIDLNYHAIVFYRLFFGGELGKGFFIEANGAYWKDVDDYGDAGKGIGVAVGGKFFRGRRFHGEFVFGYGRTLTQNPYEFEDAYPRFAISLGHRF
jgi:hypothetical protein